MFVHPFPENPETAWYFARLERERGQRRVMGILRLVIGLALALDALLTPPTRHLVYVVLPVVLPVFLMGYGGAEIRATRRPVTRHAVEWLRQQERRRLFQRAEGRLPWSYRAGGRLVEVALGLILAFAAIATAMGAGAQRATLLVGGLYGLAALLLLLDALYWKPRRAKWMQAASAAELAARLSMGEFAGEDRPPAPPQS